MTTTNNTNVKLAAAFSAKDDEFYTPYDVVAAELDQYYTQLFGKTIFCPCDDPRWSAFVRYLVNNRDKLNCTVYASCYYKADGLNTTQVAVIAAKRGNPAGILDRSDYRRPRTEVEKAFKEKMKENGIEVGVDTQITILEKAEQLKTATAAYLPTFNLTEATNKGDFEKTATFDLLLSACDVVVTNPPFSKWTGFFKTVLESGKKFLILGSNNVVGSKTADGGLVFKALKARKVWSSNAGKLNVFFNRPDGTTKEVAVVWYTNLIQSPRQAFKPKHDYTVADLKARGLWKVFDERPDVLECGCDINMIPKDYDGLIAVGAHAFYRFDNGGWEFVEPNMFCNMKIDGQRTFARIVIKRRPNYNVALEAEETKQIVETAPAIPNADHRGYIYILSDEHDRIKIGVTKNMLEQRVNDLQTGNADELTVSYLSNPVYEYEKIEAAAHQLFANDRIRGEWFDGKIFKKAVSFLTKETAPSKQDVKRFRNI